MAISVPWIYTNVRRVHKVSFTSGDLNFVTMESKDAWMYEGCLESNFCWDYLEKKPEHLSGIMVIILHTADSTFQVSAIIEALALKHVFVYSAYSKALPAMLVIPVKTFWLKLSFGYQ